MFERLKNLAGKVQDAIRSTASSVSDLNGDGKVDSEDAKIASEWAMKTANAAGDEAIRLGKNALNSDMTKDAAAGAAIGAVVAVPIPLVGPVVGATVGAGIGVYKNLTKGRSTVPHAKSQAEIPKDLYAELLKLDDLRQKGIITDAEFGGQKRKLLGDS